MRASLSESLLPGILGLFVLSLAGSAGRAAEPLWRRDALTHLRAGERREWSSFPPGATAAELTLTFESPANEQPWLLAVRQQDVKQRWAVLLNGAQLGRLVQDENDLLIYFELPTGHVRSGSNVLRVQPEQTAREDDIRVGQFAVYPVSRQERLGEARLSIEVREQPADTRIPARITLVDADGTLPELGAVSNQSLAVRAGTVYTAKGQATFDVPAGRYTVYAGRGFEYSLASSVVELASGDERTLHFELQRVVPTEGYVACDTHVHSLTHSGHGDATVQERMITLAAEGIELPVATDHNVHVNHDPFAREMDVRRYFTPVIGNEVTTPVGHFNVFPVAPDAVVPDWRLSDWREILGGIFRTRGVKAAILNHARDLHSGVRPMGPVYFNDIAGHNVADWWMGFNAMEVLNSSATQSDVLQLFRDWMALLNHGYAVTPVGSSDSHDVLRHFVGQGRTYIRCDDRDPANIDVDLAVRQFLQGGVLVSYGLLAELTVNGKYRSGESATVPSDQVELGLRVLGPQWVSAERLLLFSNGHLWREVAIDSARSASRAAGTIWEGRWTLPRPPHDVHLVAIALGPGIDAPYWRTAKPYQPVSIDWQPQVVACSGAVWLDVDGDGHGTPAVTYARRLFTQARGDLQRLLLLLEDYDWAVAAQAAWLYQNEVGTLLNEADQRAVARAAPTVRSGFHDYLSAWREGELSRN